MMKMLSYAIALDHMGCTFYLDAVHTMGVLRIIRHRKYRAAGQ